MDMRITIKNSVGRCVIISFRTIPKKFESDYERSKFFRELYGWKQTVPKNGRRYLYKRAGILDDVPHKKIADSVFLIAMEHMKRMEKFFGEWEKKVEYDIMNVTVERNRIKDLYTARQVIDNDRRN